MLLLGIAGVVLITACGNIANLLLAQASTREREMAIRLALGASRGRLIRQSLMFSLVLALTGALLGLILASGLSRVLVALLNTSGQDVFLELHTDWRLAAFAGLLGLATCVLFAWRRPQTDGYEPRNGAGIHRSRQYCWSGQHSPAPCARHRTGRALTGPGRHGPDVRRHVRNLMRENVGFDSSHVMVASLGFSAIQLPADRVTALRNETAERLRGIPQGRVERVAEAIPVPLMGGYRVNRAWADGNKDAAETVSMGWVGAGFFDALDVDLIAGREFDSRDRADSAPTAVVNETFAHAAFSATPIQLAGRCASIRRQRCPNSPTKSSVW